jgi:E3 ubiquitin-protein ligase LRSAM1
LTRLPAVLNRLQQLELLDISNNELVDIRSVSFMPNLKILNVSGNLKLEILPPEIATCENLNDLVFDIECIKSPSADVLATGTQGILKYLSTGELTAPSEYKVEDNLLKQQSKITSSRIIDESMSNAFLRREKQTIQFQDSLDNDVNELHKEQQKKKEEMLRALINQQKQAEDAVNKIHMKKDVERKRLIDDIRDCNLIDFNPKKFDD